MEGPHILAICFTNGLGSNAITVRTNGLSLYALSNGELRPVSKTTSTLPE